MSIPAVFSQGTTVAAGRTVAAGGTVPAGGTVSFTGIAQAASGAFEVTGPSVFTPSAGIEDGVGTGGCVVALRAVPRVRPDQAPHAQAKGASKAQALKAQVLKANGNGQPATNQHEYNYNPAVGGYFATPAAGPPHRRAPV